MRTLTLAIRAVVIGCFFGPRFFGTSDSTSSTSSTSFCVVLTSGPTPVDDVATTSSHNGDDDDVLSAYGEKMTSYGSFSSPPPGVVSIGIYAVADTNHKYKSMVAAQRYYDQLYSPKVDIITK